MISYHDMSHTDWLQITGQLTVRQTVTTHHTLQTTTQTGAGAGQHPHAYHHHCGTYQHQAQRKIGAKDDEGHEVHHAPSGGSAPQRHLDVDPVGHAHHDVHVQQGPGKRVESDDTVLGVGPPQGRKNLNKTFISRGLPDLSWTFKKP